jgi:energy-coupling factor transporter ATP-binding protein EcfA2
VRLEAVGKRYGIRQPWVVRGVSADLGAGRLIRVSGRNGSGKSTLLRVVAGVSLPSAGKVTGRPHAGYVPERFPGGLPFSGREYLLHLARVHGLRGVLGRRRVEEWLERLVPVVAFLTSGMLTAEPDAARACVAAAAGPVRAQLATLLVPLGAGAVLGLAATIFDVLTAEAATTAPEPGLPAKVTAVADHPGIVAGGLLIALVCLLVGSAVGALCNPPLLRHRAAAMLSTLTAIILSLAGVSPANAAISHTTAQSARPLAANWPGPASLLGAACLLAVTWTVSVIAATRRDTWSIDSD